LWNSITIAFNRHLLGKRDFEPRASFHLGQWNAAAMLGFKFRYFTNSHTPHSVNRKLVEEAMHRQNMYLAALHETTLGLISRLELNELLQTLISRAGPLLGTSHGFIFLFDPDRDDFEQKVGTGVYADLIGTRLERHEGIVGQMWQTRKPVVINDYSTWEHKVAPYSGRGFKSSSTVRGGSSHAYSRFALGRVIRCGRHPVAPDATGQRLTGLAAPASITRHP
jgi:hypothetical protein